MNEEIYAVVNGKIQELGYETVDIEKRSEHGNKIITVYVDKVPGGISLDDCELISHEIEPLLDAADPTGGQPYVLEVSSPGLDRPFKTQRDYERNYGKEIEIKLYAPIKGKKTIEGVLIEKTQGYILVQTDKGEVKLECNRAALVRPLVKFE